MVGFTTRRLIGHLSDGSEMITNKSCFSFFLHPLTLEPLLVETCYKH